jgi:hypothetical protein
MTKVPQYADLGEAMRDLPRLLADPTADLDAWQDAAQRLKPGAEDPVRAAIEARAAERGPGVPQPLSIVGRVVRVKRTTERVDAEGAEQPEVTDQAETFLAYEFDGAEYTAIVRLPGRLVDRFRVGQRVTMNLVPTAE